MNGFYIGQRVRIVRSTVRVGFTGIITDFGNWEIGDYLPRGGYLSNTILGSCNCMIQLHREDANGHVLVPSHTSNIEPILDQHQPCDTEFKESLDQLVRDMERADA